MVDNTNSLSDVIKYLESKLKQIVDLRRRGYDLRQEAIGISKQADKFVNESEFIEKEALSIAISRLGDEQGKVAYSLVISSITNDFNDEISSDFIINSDPKNNKIEVHGISILEKYKEESDLIIQEAMNSSVDNPYATDRGKNAWRRLLFNKVREGNSNSKNDNKPLENSENSDIKNISFKSHSVPKFLKGL